MDADLQQRLELTRLLLDSGEEPNLLADAGRRLAVRLYELSADNRLWRRLRRDADHRSLLPFAMLPLIDWAPILDTMNYVEPPSKVFVGGECVRLLTRATTSEEAVDWTLLREHLTWLADRLGRETDEPWAGRDDSARRRLRFEVGRAWNVVRRVDLMKVSIDAAPKLSDAAFAAFAPPPINLGVVLTKLAVNLGLSLGRELSAATADVAEDRRRSAVQDIADSEAFRRGQTGRLTADISVLGPLLVELLGTQGLAGAPLGGVPPEIASPIERLTEWQSYVAAELASAWGYVALSSPRDLPVLDRSATELVSLRQQLRDLQRAIEHGDGRSALRAAEIIRPVPERISEDLSSLLVALQPLLDHR